MSMLIPSFSSDHNRDLFIFEIYPQSEIPLLSQIAHLDWFLPTEDPAHLLPDIMIFRVVHRVGIFFRVVDYRTNYSTCFRASVDVDIVTNDVEVFFCSFQDVEVSF